MSRLLLAFAIAVTCACGGSGASVGAETTAPGAPAIGTAIAGDGQATVSFTPPSSNGGAQITRYTVTSSPGAITATGPSSPVTVTGLTNGVSYTFTVSATNSVGTGPASAVSNGVAPTAASGNSCDTQTVTNPQGLTAMASGQVVYDANQEVYWLANANLAADSSIRQMLGVSGVGPNGTMDYPTALLWVNALNLVDGGNGYLGHNNWQLPVTPLNDGTCSSSNNGSFGASCTGSALGNLYSVGLNRTFPDSVTPDFANSISPMQNLQPSLYWTSDENTGGQVTFSFDTGLSGANTTKYNYFHVLPMIPGVIGTKPPGSSGVVPYETGPAAGLAVYDVNADVSWTLDANLAASATFGISGTTTITSSVDGSALTPPLIDVDGAMLLATATTSDGWLDAMNRNAYAGGSNWMLPSLQDIEALFSDLQLQPGDSRLTWQGCAGPFENLQPFFYWACERNSPGNRQSVCDPNLSPANGPGGVAMAWSFDFDNGFQGTDETSKQFYVMVYYPSTTAP